MIHQIENRPTRSTATKALILGFMLAALMSMALAASKPAHAATTFTVNSTRDYGDVTPGDGKCAAGTSMLIGEGCTLRAAIQEANAFPGADTINFDISGTGVKTISPASALPAIIKPVTIDGYTQPGAKPNTLVVGTNAVLKIELSGASSTGSGLRIEAANSTVKGLVINRWGEGIRIDGSGTTGNKVAGNYIGTDATGTQDLGNGYYGVAIDGANNTIGGATVGARNVISGNDLSGLLVEDTSVGGHKIMGNYIGTDKTGTAPLGNSDEGVVIDDAPNNIVGGTTVAARNVISANGGEGVTIYGAGGNKVAGNYIGTDASGTQDLGNGSPLGIGGSGVFIADAPNNTIGGPDAGAGNVISANDVVGVRIQGTDATGNRVLSNSIFASGGLGIDLNADGPTPNDPKDSDTGPNYLQNFPVLSSAKKNAAATTTVKGKLNSTPDKTFRLQFFSNPKGTDEGKTLLGSQIVSTNGSGDVSFTFSTKKAIRLGQNITATAAGPGGNTSEFSAPKQVVAN